VSRFTCDRVPAHRSPATFAIHRSTGPGPGQRFFEKVQGGSAGARLLGERRYWRRHYRSLEDLVLRLCIRTLDPSKVTTMKQSRLIPCSYARGGLKTRHRALVTRVLEEYRPEAAALSEDVFYALQSVFNSLVNEGSGVSNSAFLAADRLL
jgi:hypothetical protein